VISIHNDNWIDCEATIEVPLVKVKESLMVVEKVDFVIALKPAK